MTKASQQNRVHTRDGKPVIYEQQTVIDDGLLPSADELKKLQEVDENIVGWLMRRSEREQEHRHEFTDKRVALAKKELNGNIAINVLCIVFAFLLVVLGMGVSVYFVVQGLSVVGTIFAGATLVGAAALFTRIPGRKSPKG